MWTRTGSNACEVSSAKITKGSDEANSFPLPPQRKVVSEKNSRNGLWGKFGKPFGFSDGSFGVDQSTERYKGRPKLAIVATSPGRGTVEENVNNIAQETEATHSKRPVHKWGANILERSAGSLDNSAYHTLSNTIRALYSDGCRPKCDPE